jgi:TonB family protein
MVAALVVAVLQPAESGAQFASAPPLSPYDPRIACGTIFAATSTSEPGAVVVRIVDLTDPFDGTIKAYGADRVWTAHVSTSARAVRKTEIENSRFGWLSTQREDSVLVRAEGPIEGVEFDPSWSSCAFRTGVRPPRASDGPDVPRPTVVASNAAPVEPVACAMRYVEPDVTRVRAPDVPSMATQQGITGTVRVQVALDERGGVTFARIVTSPSSILNRAALDAARTSSYRGAVFRCAPVPGGTELSLIFR